MFIYIIYIILKIPHIIHRKDTYKSVCQVDVILLRRSSKPTLLSLIFTVRDITFIGDIVVTNKVHIPNYLLPTKYKQVLATVVMGSLLQWYVSCPQVVGNLHLQFTVYSKYTKSTQVEILLWFFFLIVSPNPLYLNLWKPALQKKCHPQWMKFKISQCQIRTNNLSKQKANLTICWVNLCRGKIV